MGKDAKLPPDGLNQCPFFVEKAQTPIILLPLTEAELRLQQNNFNSSKALSSLSRQDRHTALHSTLNGGEGGSPSSGGWTLAGNIELVEYLLKLTEYVILGGPRSGFGATKAQAPVQNRWSALTSSGSSKPAGTHPTRRVPEGTKLPEQRPPNSSSSSIGRNRERATSDDTPPIPAQSSTTKAETPVKDPSRTDQHAWKSSETVDTYDTWKSIEADIHATSLVLDDISPGTSLMSNGLFLLFCYLAHHSPQNAPSAVSQQATMATHPEIVEQRRKEEIHSMANSKQPQTSQMLVSEKSADKAMWHYLDPSGNQQGPFDGQRMHNWFESHYFTKDLRLCRVGDESFTTLGKPILSH